jgi:phospholipid/cholesterol/gamma-HCH transport system substrate-binding protein
MQQNNVAETLIGAAVVAVAVAFLAFAYFRTGWGSLSGYEINARLAKVDGLAVGTDVRLAGIKIGTVTDLTLDPKTYLVTVHMNIRDDIKLPTDSSVLVTQAGFLGGQYLSVTPGGDDKMMVAGSYFDSAQGSIDMMNLVGRFAGGESTSNQPPKPKAPQGQAPQAAAPQSAAPQAAAPQATQPPTPMKAPDPGAGP